MSYYPGKQNKLTKTEMPEVITFHCVYEYIFFGNTMWCYILGLHTVIKVTVQFSNLVTKAYIYNMYIKCIRVCRIVNHNRNFDYFFSLSGFCFFVLGGGSFLFIKKLKKRQFKIRFYHLKFVMHV